MSLTPFWCLYCELWTYLTHFSIVCLVDFEYVSVCWVEFVLVTSLLTLLLTQSFCSQIFLFVVPSVRKFVSNLRISFFVIYGMVIEGRCGFAWQSLIFCWLLEMLIFSQIAGFFFIGCQVCPRLPSVVSRLEDSRELRYHWKENEKESESKGASTHF